MTVPVGPVVNARKPYQFTFQRAPAFNVEGLVDGLVADTHGLIIGEVQPKTGVEDAICDSYEKRRFLGLDSTVKQVANLVRAGDEVVHADAGY